MQNERGKWDGPLHLKEDASPGEALAKEAGANALENARAHAMQEKREKWRILYVLAALGGALIFGAAFDSLGAAIGSVLLAMFGLSARAYQVDGLFPRWVDRVHRGLRQ